MPVLGNIKVVQSGRGLKIATFAQSIAAGGTFTAVAADFGLRQIVSVVSVVSNVTGSTVSEVFFDGTTVSFDAIAALLAVGTITVLGQ